MRTARFNFTAALSWSRFNKLSAFRLRLGLVEVVLLVTLPNKW